ncbi:hypothetical protein GCK32_007089 [Trichostrongylus colubriformis]|uniref:Peptidase A2 domain-containing protein n=1 Tax=Trichostrongylus colubriformis TaxID=6319 RepID=A0AAN8FSW8_TRICO
MSKITLILRCLEDEYNSLKEAVDIYKDVTQPNKPPKEDKSQIRIYCEERQCELQTAHEVVSNKLGELLNIYENVMKIYGEAPKAEKKEMLAEIDQFKQKCDFRALKKEAENIITAFNARIREIKAQVNILDIPLQTSSTHQPDEGLQPITEDDYDDADPCGLLQNVQRQPPTKREQMKWEGDESEKELDISPTLKIKYPQVKLPHFSGENDCWEEFWDNFSLLIDQNPQFGELEKILYLKEAIRGKAQSAIKSIPMKTSNYKVIVEVLHKKFGNKANNRSHIVQQLLEIPKAATSAEKCVETLEHINDLVFQMVATGYDIRKKHDPLWIDTILAKFPYEVIKDCLRLTSMDSKLTVGKLLDELQEQVSSRALCEDRYASLIPTRTSAGTLQRTKGFKQEHCLFCQRGNHQTKDCRIVRTPVDRRNALRGQTICWKCFAADHRSRACVQRNCLNCNGDHHISLCISRTGETSSATSTFSKSQDKAQKTSYNSGTKSGKPKDTYRNQTSHTTVRTGQQDVSHKDEQKAVNSFSNQTEGNLHEKNLILMTVEGQMKNNATNSFENVLIFLDSGAQCNLIDDNLAETLALTRSEPYKCTMHGIGGSVQTYTAHQVTAVFRTRFGECVSINMSTKPVLTNAFPSATLTPSDVQFLKQNRIFLSNTATNGQLVKPSVLIGVESYEQIVLLDSTPTKLPSGLLAQNTVFGPALFGKSHTPEESEMCSHHTLVACPEVISDIKRELKDIDWLSGPRWFKLKEANWPIESPSSPATETYDESQEGIDATPICAPTSTDTRNENAVTVDRKGQCCKQQKHCPNIAPTLLARQRTDI